ncbi:Xyloglucan 6-xylosyltransferase 1 [Glycine max]|nr:Xyloglucan 6-xylosyltransferase 1 [Glycine max]
MLEKCLGVQRARRFHRALRHCKVTILCLVLTIIVLRGTIGAGKFGTPEQDFVDIRNRFYSLKLPEPHRLLAELHSTTTPFQSSTSTNNYNAFDINTILVDEKEDENLENFNPHQPYRLGPKISNWNEQRSRWLRENPNFSNFLRPNKPRVLLVTGSSPKPCENPVGDYYLLKAIKNKIDYCRLHGIEAFYNMALLDAEIAGFWAKLPLIRKLLLSHPEVEFLWWMDSDAMFTDMSSSCRGRGIKTPIWNCQWSLDILDAWAPMGPKGKVRDEAGKVLTRELKDRPVFEADDQSAMVYLLAKERDKWEGKVYLENGYYLHGYWGILVDRYEEMIENYHPGFGDHRWPLVTHFVGCKPCGKFGDYPVERCLKQMDRAFNFGDNQILQIYGFTHESLGSRGRVKRIRNETSNPLEV